MLSYESIQDIRKEHEREAEDAGLAPASIKGFDPQNPREFIRHIPFLGEYCPAGWTPAPGIDDLFVDSSGFCGPGEAALTIDQFTAKLAAFQRSGDNYGFGIYEAGQFQVYIRVYRPDPRDFTHSGALAPYDLAKLTARSY